MRIFSKGLNPDKENLFSGSVIATTSGTSHDFTGIPAGTKRITLGVTGLSTNSTSIIMFQIGDSGGIEATGYAGNVMGTNGYTTPVNLGVVGSGFQIYDSNAGTFIFTGVAILTLVDSATNTWAMHGTFARTETAAGIGIVAGSKSLTGTLDRVRLTTVNGSDTFDAGLFNILYE